MSPSVPSPSSAAPSPVFRELILGGQRSGKSRRAEALAQAWLGAGVPGRRAVFIATGTAQDDEMRARIERHRADRAARLPSMQTVEAPLALADALQQHLSPDCLVVVDCLTLWLVNQALQLEGFAEAEGTQAFLKAIEEVRGPVVMVSNEIGLGVVPLGREVRAYVDALGWLNQQVAARCDRVCLMAAGLPLWLKPAGGLMAGAGMVNAVEGMDAAMAHDPLAVQVDGAVLPETAGHVAGHGLAGQPVPGVAAAPTKARKFIKNAKGERIEWQD